MLGHVRAKTFAADGERERGPALVVDVDRVGGNLVWPRRELGLQLAAKSSRGPSFSMISVRTRRGTAKPSQSIALARWNTASMVRVVLPLPPFAASIKNPAR
jgi:hypothetical protein